MTEVAPSAPSAVPDLAPQLRTALMAPAPRTGDAFRTVLRAQRGSWRWIYAYVILVALFGGVYTWFSTDPISQSPVLWLAVVGSPFVLLLALLNYVTARRLAHHGVFSPARIKRLDDDVFALYYGDDLNLGRRRSVWRSDRPLASDAHAYTLFHPQRRSAYAWVAGVGGVAQQEAREKPPRAQLRRV